MNPYRRHLLLNQRTYFDSSLISLSNRKLYCSGVGWGKRWTTMTPYDMGGGNWGNCWYNSYPQLLLINPQPTTHNPQPTALLFALLHGTSNNFWTLPDFRNPPQRNQPAVQIQAPSSGFGCPKISEQTLTLASSPSRLGNFITQV